MKLLHQFTLERSVFSPDFRGPQLIGRCNDPPIIRTSDFDPDILVFRDGAWRLLTSCHRDTPDTLWDMEPSPHGILLTRLQAGEPYDRVIQSAFLDPLSGTPRFPPLMGLFVRAYLANGTLLCQEESTQAFVCVSPDGAPLWCLPIAQAENVQQDTSFIYFQDGKNICIYDFQGQLVGSFSSPDDLAARNLWESHLSFSGDTLSITGLSSDTSRYMAWELTGKHTHSQVFSELSCFPELWRLSIRGPHALLVSMLSDSQRAGVGTQCSLLSNQAPSPPIPLLSYREKEPTGGEVLWLDDETFIFVQFGQEHSSFWVYSIHGECLADKTDLPGLLWMENFFFADGLLYFQTSDSTDNGKTLLYHFTVYQI